MKKIRIFPVFLLLVALAPLPGCIPVVAVGAGAGAAIGYEDRRTAGTMVEDEGIELRFSNRVSERFGDKVHVNMTSYNRSVLLTGEVPDDKIKAEIEKIAQAVSNVRGVTSDLQVGPASSFSSRAGDSGITGKVKARFIDSGKFSVIHVKVVTEASVVYLLGWVTEAEANNAVEIARTTGGVRKVVKVFEYCKDTDPVCAPRAKPKADEPKKDAKK
ncbi:MAG: BON domain-containing protein [Verrucomicrobiota bacterium]